MRLFLCLAVALLELPSMAVRLPAPTVNPSSLLPLAIAMILRLTLRASMVAIGLLRPTAVATTRTASTSTRTITSVATVLL